MADQVAESIKLGYTMEPRIIRIGSQTLTGARLKSI